MIKFLNLEKKEINSKFADFGEQKKKDMLHKLILLLKSKKLWLNIFSMAVIAMLVFWGSLRWLKSYTQHGESVTVPDLRKMTLEEADRLLENQNLSYHIMDSVYRQDCVPTEIIAQVPPPGMKVKEHRHIYVTINSTIPPKTKLPDLNGKSLRNAINILANNDLEMGEISYEPYPFANAVIRAEFEGKEIMAGTECIKGSKIDLVVGNGLGETKVSVPSLWGKTLEEARFILHGGYNLNIGQIVLSENISTREDSTMAVIYRQFPKPSEEKTLRWGEFIDVWLMKREAFEIMKDTILPSI